jgi:hypothetical protein
MSQRSRLRAAVLAVAVTTALTPAGSRAQVAQDAELRRAVATFQAGEPLTALTVISRLPMSRLSRGDQAIAEMYRGFAFMRLRRASDGEGALARAVVLDPTKRPDPQAISQDLLDAYRVARSRVPVIATFDFSPRDFIPELDSITRLTYTLEGNRLLRRTRAEMRFTVIPGGTADSVVLWRGTEGDEFSWDGKLRAELIPAGEYEYILEARAPTLSLTNIARRLVTITHGVADMSKALPLPQEPRVLPESTVFSVENSDRKRRLVNRGLKLAAIGSILAVATAASTNAVVDRTAPQSAGRYVLAGTYVLGLSTATLGAITTLRGRLSTFKSDVTFPNNENIRINREARLQYQRDRERAEAHNARLSRATAVKQTYHEEQR